MSSKLKYCLPWITQLPKQSRYGDRILESLLTPLWSVHEPLGDWLVWFSPKRQCLWELKQGIVNFYFVFWGKVSPCSPSCPGTYTPRQDWPWIQRSLSLHLPSAERKGVCHQAQHEIVKFLKKGLMGPPNFSLLGSLYLHKLTTPVACVWRSHAGHCGVNSLVFGNRTPQFPSLVDWTFMGIIWPRLGRDSVCVCPWG